VVIEAWLKQAPQHSFWYEQNNHFSLFLILSDAKLKCLPVPATFCFGVSEKWSNAFKMPNSWWWKPHPGDSQHLQFCFALQYWPSLYWNIYQPTDEQNMFALPSLLDFFSSSSVLVGANNLIHY